MRLMRLRLGLLLLTFGVLFAVSGQSGALLYGLLFVVVGGLLIVK